MGWRYGVRRRYGGMYCTFTHALSYCVFLGCIVCVPYVCSVWIMYIQYGWIRADLGRMHPHPHPHNPTTSLARRSLPLVAAAFLWGTLVHT